MKTNFGRLALLMTLVVAAAALSIAAIAQARGRTLVASKPIVMRMQRSCWTCPNYAITVNSDGMVTFDGSAHTRMPGSHVVWVDARVASNLISDFIQADVFGMDEFYTSPGSDAMMVTFTFEIDGQTKTVHVEDRFGPMALLEIEQRLDDLPGMRALSGWAY